MGVTYFKRFRMEIDLPGLDLSKRTVGSGFRFLSWSERLLESHARTKFLAFHSEIDAHVFPCLGELDGCRRLMGEISRKPGFLPEATWLAVCRANGKTTSEGCGTVQGIRDQRGLGGIQNLGICPEFRNAGLGTSLLFHALAGFRQAGVRRVRLEVTADNTGAIRLYLRLGFRVLKTVYRAAEVVCC